MILIRSILAAALCVAPTLVLAQANPSRINECTFLRDPTDLRYCLYVEQGIKPAPPITILVNGEDPLSRGASYRTGVFYTEPPTQNPQSSRPKVRVRLGFAESAIIPQQSHGNPFTKSDRYAVHIEQVPTRSGSNTGRFPDRRGEVYLRQGGF